MEKLSVQVGCEFKARRRVITVGDGDVPMLEFGPAERGLDVLFLHANGFNGMTYRHVLSPLARDLRILAVDLRGHGLNRRKALVDGHSWRVYADDVLALLPALGKMPRMLAGHSMGATTALLALPSIVDPPAVVLFDPVLAPRDAYRNATADWDTPIARAAARRKDDFANVEAAFGMYRGRGAFRTWPDAMLLDYLTDGLVAGEGGRMRLACTPAWEAANFASYCVADPYPALDAARSRISIYRAAENSTCHYAPESAAGQVTLEVVPGTTHFMPMERPDMVAAAVRSVVREATGAK
jgi:pimeloyl-ACP methyl ester carboxylesterase